jgi:hypothetical protein
MVVLEFIFEVFGEFLLQLALQVLLELGFEIASAPFRRAAHPGWAAAGYALLGLLAGGFSLLIVPVSLVHGHWRLVNLVLAPVLAGAVMSALGGWRAAWRADRSRLERFGFGYLFALALALVRFWCAAP